MATHGKQAQENSYWPIVLAGALLVTMLGLLLNFVISLAGVAIGIAAMVAWGVQSFHAPAPPKAGPREKVELPPLTGVTAATEVPLEVGRSPAWWGMVWFIATEATFVAFLIAGYVYLRATSQIWPPPGTPQHALLFPSINTAILLLSGVPAYFAETAIRNDDQRGLRSGLLLAAALGAIFLAGQGYEYLNAGFSPDTNIFGAGFFVLTGFHGAHVLVGILLLLTIFGLSRGSRYSSQHNFPVQFAGTYWHFVDAVWVVLFTTLYLAQ